MQESTDKKKQWSYKESFFFLGGLVLLGFIIEFISGGAGFSSPPFPYNVTILCELVVLIPLAFFMYSTSPVSYTHLDVYKRQSLKGTFGMSPKMRSRLNPIGK